MSLVELTEGNPREFIGGNNPPQPTTAEEMQTAHAALLSRVSIMTARFEKLPKVLKDDTDDGRASDLGADVGELVRKLKDTCVEEGRPYFQKHKEINAFFKPIWEPLEATLEALKTRVLDYKEAKEAAARRELELAAQKAKEEADRQRALADKAEGEGKVGKALVHEDRADAAQDRADRAAVAASASAADLSRVRSTNGTLSTVKGGWTYLIDDFNAIPLDELRTFIGREAIEKALGKYVKLHKADAPPLKGVRFVQEKQANFRR